MRMVAAGIVVFGLTTSAQAQSVTGTVDWSYGRASYGNDGDPSLTSTLTQSYSVGYNSTLWDPRFLQYSGHLTWQRQGLTRSGTRSTSRQLAFRALGSFFPSRPFPVSIEVSRGTGREAGDFPSSNVVQGGLNLLPAELIRDLDTRTSLLSVTSQVLARHLPRIDFHYKRGTAAMALGEIDAEQRDSTLALSLSHGARRTRGALRYTRNATENHVNRLFRQQVSDLAYTASTDLAGRTRADVRAGYRDMYSLTNPGPQYVDLGRELYRPSTGGQSSLAYGAASLAYQSARRLTSSVSVSLDRQAATSGSARGLLVSSESRYLIPGGLSLQATGNYGRRGQSVRGDRLEVGTRGLSAGANWRVPLRAVPVSLGYSEVRGWHEEATGRSGLTRGRQAHVSASASPVRWAELGGGLERARARDDLLFFGNYSADRARAMARIRAGRRVSFEASWERAVSDRGTGELSSTSRVRTSSASAQYLVSDRSRLVVSTGQFDSETSGAPDRNRFLLASYESLIAPGLHLVLTGRREQVRLGRSKLLREGLLTTGRLEYRLTRFTFSVDYRLTDLTLDTGDRESPVVGFRGNQFQVRVSRRFTFQP